MKYRQTPIYDNVMTIYDEAGEAAILDLNDDIARILYCDCSTTLLKLAEAEAIKAEKRVISAGFSSFNDRFRSFLEENGFRSEGSGSILAVDLKDILESVEVSKLLQVPGEEFEWIPFRDLMSFQVEELEELLDTLHLAIRREEILRFDSNLSGIVYDCKRKIRDYDLALVSGTDLVFEGLISNDSQDERAKKAAIRGFVSQLIDCYMTEEYERIVFVDPERKNLELISSLLDDPKRLESIGSMLSARKNLKKIQGTDLPKVELNYGAEARIIELSADKLEAVPFQSNINWKLGDF